MPSLEEKRLQAPPALVAAVDLVRECIKSASRRLSNSRLAQLIERLLDQNKRRLSYTIRFRVKEDRVDIFDGPPHDHAHAHVAISQADGEPYYWRNYSDPRGSLNYLR
jgi:hypothetical protein